MVKELVFHIGDHKTGSTSIQQALLSETYHCDGVTLAYPVNPNQLHHRVQAETLFKPARMAKRDRAFATLARRLRKSDADIGIISAESFEWVKPEVLQDTLRNHMPGLANKTRVIAYVRPHADRIVSSFIQLVKMGNGQRNLESYINRTGKVGRYMYTPRLSAWRDTFGDRFILRPMIRDELDGGDVVQDFFRVLLGVRPFTLGPVTRANEGVSVSDVAMLSVLGAIESARAGSGQRHGRAGWHLSRLLAANPPAHPERLEISQPLMDKIETLYRADAVALDQAFFDGRPLMADAMDRARAHARAETQSTALADHYDADTRRLIAVFAGLTDDLLARNPEEWREQMDG